MTFEAYLDKLNKLAATRPETLEMNVMYAKDDEGNDYRDVVFDPSVVKNLDGDIHPECPEPDTVIIN